jgi:hypothetical protein
MRIDIGIVPPDTWRNSELCRRQLSWYWTSPFAGMYLVISAEPLTELGYPPQIILRESNFRPPALPNEADQRAMIQRQSYLTAKPEEWDNPDNEEQSRLDRWLKLMGIRGKTFKELFITHCANHANFIEPVYFIERNGEKIPYSIGKTIEICSACIEFFNIIGKDNAHKLVVPCPGAVMYAGLAVNRYIEVQTLY